MAYGIQGLQERLNGLGKIFNATSGPELVEASVVGSAALDLRTAIDTDLQVLNGFDASTTERVRRGLLSNALSKVRNLEVTAVKRGKWPF